MNQTHITDPRLVAIKQSADQLAGILRLSGLGPTAESWMHVIDAQLSSLHGEMNAQAKATVASDGGQSTASPCG